MGDNVVIQRIFEPTVVQNTTAVPTVAQGPPTNVTVEQNVEDVTVIGPSGPTQSLPVSADARKGIALTGTINGVNTTFTTPEAFVRVIGGETISVYYNGQRLFEGGSDDYTLGESGGAGTGFDTVTTTFAPLAGDVLTSDYTKA